MFRRKQVTSRIALGEGLPVLALTPANVRRGDCARRPRRSWLQDARSSVGQAEPRGISWRR